MNYSKTGFMPSLDGGTSRLAGGTLPSQEIFDQIVEISSALRDSPGMGFRAASGDWCS